MPVCCIASGSLVNKTATRLTAARGLNRDIACPWERGRPGNQKDVRPEWHSDFCKALQNNDRSHQPSPRSRTLCPSALRSASPGPEPSGEPQRDRLRPWTSPGAPRRFPSDLINRPSFRKWRKFCEHRSLVQRCDCSLATLGVRSSQQLTRFHVTLWSIKSFVKHFSQSPG